MSTWEERMAARAAALRAAADAERERREAEERARLAAEFPPVEGEHDYVETEGPHRGHRTHIDAWHPGVVMCSCGGHLGVYSFAIGPDWPQPEPCPVRIARGIPLGPPGG